MGKHLNKRVTQAIKYLSKYIPYPNLGETDFFVEWKNRLLFFILGGLVSLGFIAYIPSLILSIKEQLWAVAGLDTFVYSAVLYIAFSKKLAGHKKIIGSIVVFYVLGISLLLFLGKDGAGFNWLFIFPILTSFFYGFRGATYATIVNFVTLTVLTVPVHFEFANVGLISEYGTAGWIVNAVNFFAISTFFSYSLVIIISNIDEAWKKEKELILLLQENQEKLSIEKERAEESDRLKSTFLSNMSHEIRTPMNSILGFSELLSDPSNNAEQAQKFKRLIHLSGEQLIRIIDDIIDISKIELNQMDVKLAPVEIHPRLNEIIDVQKNKIRTLGKDLKINLTIPNKLKDITIVSDEFRFKQIVNNLVGNAVKYTDKGNIEIGYITKTEKDKPVIEFFVKDTGRGIPKEAHQKIFDRFTQADNIDFKEGTGLGLSITKGLLTLLGGDIHLESELEKGSIFYFTLPLNETFAKKSKPITKTETVDLQGKNIYIAEDDTISMYYLKELLRPTQAQIGMAADGKELLDMIQTKTPDLILLDINMPVMNGFEAIQEIRKTNSEIPVIAQTAYAMIEEKQKCISLGCNDYISKPIKKEKLFKVLHSYLSLETHS